MFDKIISLLEGAELYFRRVKDGDISINREGLMESMKEDFEREMKDTDYRLHEALENGDMVDEKINEDTDEDMDEDDEGSVEDEELEESKKPRKVRIKSFKDLEKYAGQRVIVPIKDLEKVLEGDIVDDEDAIEEEEESDSGMDIDEAIERIWEEFSAGELNEMGGDGNPNPEGRFVKGTDHKGGQGEPEWRANLSDKAFAIPERRAWPIHDEKHAKISIVFMYRGFGDKKEYPRIVKAIAARYKDNKEIMDKLKALVKALKLNVSL